MGTKMKKVARVIEILTRIEDGKDIFDTNDARFLSRFRHTNPNYIKLVYPEYPKPHLPYFHATLTDQGKQYLKKLRSNHAIPGLRETVRNI